MSKKQIISTENAPAAIGPYNQAVRAGDMLYISGQIPLDPSTGKLVEGGIDVKTRRCMDNLKAILNAAGGGIENLIKVNIFTVDMGKFAEINKVYSTYFEGPPPARAVVEVSALPLGCEVEIEGVAYLA